MTAPGGSGDRPLVRVGPLAALREQRERGQRLEAAPRVGDWVEPVLLNGVADAGPPFPTLAYRWAEHQESPGSLQWRGAIVPPSLPIVVCEIQPEHAILDGDAFFPVARKTGGATFDLVVLYFDMTTYEVTAYPVTF